MVNIVLVQISYILFKTFYGFPPSLFIFYKIAFNPYLLPLSSSLALLFLTYAEFYLFNA